MTPARKEELARHAGPIEDEPQLPKFDILSTQNVKALHHMFIKWHLLSDTLVVDEDAFDDQEL